MNGSEYLIKVFSTDCVFKPSRRLQLVSHLRGGNLTVEQMLLRYSPWRCGA